jgi:hypothetical protein
MSKDLKADREGLLRAATLVRPALATAAHIPALTHIAFDGEWATGYDDKMALSVRCDADLDCLVPGVLFTQALNSFGSKDVVVRRNEDQTITLQSGRSRVTLATLPLRDFPLTWPRDPEFSFEVESDMMKGIERCLISVNTDANQPAQMGITLDRTEDGYAVFFSTDNASVSRAQCGSRIQLPGDVPIILPRQFCEQLLALNKAYPGHMCNMDVGDGWVDVVFYLDPDKGHDARLFSRMLVDLDPIEFPKLIQRHCGDVTALKKRTTTIPDGLDAALSRALLVLGNEGRKRCMAHVKDEVLDLHAHSDYGDSDDHIKLDHDNVGPVPLDAFAVSRGLKQATRIGINDTVTILVHGDDSTFVHMVAHVRDMK